MLGDGSIRNNNIARNMKVSKGNCRYNMTIGAYALNYMQSLLDSTYTTYSSTGLIPYPNPKSPNFTGTITQYYFSTKSLPIFTALHELWYQLDPTLGWFVKIVPTIIGEMFSAVCLAH